MAVKDKETKEENCENDIPLMPMNENEREESKGLVEVHGVKPLTSHDSTRRNEIEQSSCRSGCFKWCKRQYLFFIPVISILIYVIDVISDVCTAVVYFFDFNYWYFALAITFVIAPGIVINVHNLNWYISDHRKGHTISKWKRVLIGVLIVFHVAPVLRYYYLFQEEKRVRPKRKSPRELDEEDKERIAKRDYDSSFLKLLESYLESAPQLVIQICVLLQTSHKIAWQQAISIFFSLLSLSLSMVFIQKFKQETIKGQNFSFWQQGLRAFIQYLLVASRILAMSLVATVYPYRLVALMVAHWFLMVLLILQLGLVDGNKTTMAFRLKQIGKYAELAVILLFSFISIKKGNNLRNAIFFYAIVFIENVMMMVWWENYCDLRIWYYLPGIILHYSFFFIGIVMLIAINLKYWSRKLYDDKYEQSQSA